MADLKWSIQNGDIEKVQSFVEKDGDAISSSIDGRTPVMIAADYGQAKILEYLISKGLEASLLDSPDKHGITPLLAAVFEGHTECVKILINAGCDKKGKAPDGRTYAEVAEKTEIIREMLQWVNKTGAHIGK